MALNEQQELFLELLFDENISSPQEAAKLAGYKAPVSTIVKSKEMSKAILERTQQFTALHAPHAIMTLIDATKNPEKKGIMNAITASKELLDRGGLVRKDKLEVETTVVQPVVQLPELNKE
jgi:hypothetical protein